MIPDDVVGFEASAVSPMVNGEVPGSQWWRRPPLEPWSRRPHRTMADSSADTGIRGRRCGTFDALGADTRQIAGIAAVVAADDEHQVEAFGVEGQGRRLTFLCRAADGVECPKVMGGVGFA